MHPFVSVQGRMMNSTGLLTYALLATGILLSVLARVLKRRKPAPVLSFQEEVHATVARVLAMSRRGKKKVKTSKLHPGSENDFGMEEKSVHFTNTAENDEKSLHPSNEVQRLSETTLSRIIGLIGRVGSENNLAHRVFRAIDTQDDGYVTVHQFIHFVTILMRGSTSERARFAFDLIDVKRTGYVTYELFHDFIRLRSNITNYETDYKYLFEKIDLHNKGYVTFHEFNEALENKETFRFFVPVSSMGRDLNNEEQNVLTVHFGHSRFDLVMRVMMFVGCSTSQKPATSACNASTRSHCIYLENGEKVEWTEDGVEVFQQIRSSLGICDEALRHSIGIDQFFNGLMVGRLSTFLIVPSCGKSGAPLFKTIDEKFIIKVISKKEYETLRTILPKYCRHVMDVAGTLLCPVLGMYNFEIPRRGFRYVVLMANTLGGCQVVQKYDLKGATFGRNLHSVPKHRAPRHSKHNRTANNNDSFHGTNIGLKTAESQNECHTCTSSDLSSSTCMQRMVTSQKSIWSLSNVQLDGDVTKSKRKFCLGNRRNEILYILRRDTRFLASCGLYDYSILVAEHVFCPWDDSFTAVPAPDDFLPRHPYSLHTHYRYRSPQETAPNGNVDAGSVCFSMNIVDFFTRYDVFRSLEWSLKSVSVAFTESVSACPPWFYAARLVCFFTAITSGRVDSKVRTPHFASLQNVHCLGDEKEDVL